jgi:excisionase family DNA binding protein
MKGNLLALPAERLWTVRDAAAYLRLGRNAVYELAKAGDLPSVRIGARVLFLPADVHAFVEGKRQPGKAA